MTNIYHTEVDGRSYEIVTTPENYNEPFYKYAAIYRLKKDGSRGAQLTSYRGAAWEAWVKVSEEADKKEGRA